MLRIWLGTLGLSEIGDDGLLGDLNSVVDRRRVTSPGRWVFLDAEARFPHCSNAIFLALLGKVISSLNPGIPVDNIVFKVKEVVVEDNILKVGLEKTRPR
jgi:hypothetical protein